MTISYGHLKKDKMDIKNGHKQWTLEMVILYVHWLPDIQKRIKCTLKMNLSNVHTKCTAIMYTKTVHNISLLLNYSHKCSLYKTICEFQF